MFAFQLATEAKNNIYFKVFLSTVYGNHKSIFTSAYISGHAQRHERFMSYETSVYILKKKNATCRHISNNVTVREFYGFGDEEKTQIDSWHVTPRAER